MKNFPLIFTVISLIYSSFGFTSAPRQKQDFFAQNSTNGILTNLTTGEKYIIPLNTKKYRIDYDRYILELYAEIPSSI